MDSDPPRLPNIVKSKGDQRKNKLTVNADNSSPQSPPLDIKPLHLPEIKRPAKSTPRQIDGE